MVNMPPLYWERILERRARFEHHQVYPMPEAWEYQEPVTLGDFSAVTLQTKRRFLNTHNCQVVADDETGAIYESPSSLARDYLKTHFKTGPKITHTQAQAIKLSTYAAPLYARPGMFPQGFYLDIQATYFSIMLRAGWDVDYFPGRWLGRGRSVADFPFPRNKIARNCLASVGVCTTVNQYHPDKGILVIRRWNPLINYQIIRLISDILNVLGAEAVRLGAVYVHTDGFIFKDWAAFERMSQIVIDWGLTPRLKSHGPGEVRGVGAYALGKAKSRRKLISQKPIDMVRVVDYARWLQPRFARLATLTPVSEVDLC